jgi:arabinogalactan oligomer / maltooligosaccharide transport system permease protein
LRIRGIRQDEVSCDQVWEYLSTAGEILVTIPAVLVFLFAQRYLVSGLTRGGVKG